jgi:HAD superfamily hydrolase (TIGR01509 family)
VADIFIMLIEEATHLSKKPNLDDVLATKKMFSKKAIEQIGTPAIEAVVAVARKYHGKIPLAVASSGNRDAVIGSLKDNDILHLFDAVITCEEVQHPKPAPDIFLLAAKKINCDPTKCRGYEDADMGVLSVKAAGMEVVDVRLMKGYPHVVNPSTRSVLLMSRHAEDGDSRHVYNDKQAAPIPVESQEDKSREAGGSFLFSMLQALLLCAVVYGAYLLLGHLVYEAVKEDAWSED